MIAQTELALLIAFMIGLGAGYFLRGRNKAKTYELRELKER
jgi:uncharacterized protein HemX